LKWHLNQTENCGPRAIADAINEIEKKHGLHFYLNKPGT